MGVQRVKNGGELQTTIVKGGFAEHFYEQIIALCFVCSN